MPTYIYETVPANAGETSERFEHRQSINDAPLEAHPVTGARVRRVLSGGLATFTHGGGGGDGRRTASGAPVGCGSGCACVS